MSLQHLVSCVQKNPRELLRTMRVDCDAIVINQDVPYSYEEFPFGREDSGSGEHLARVFSCGERGVGLSRNTALERADHALCLFGDEDLVYADGYAEAVERSFAEHPEADLLLFNVKVTEERRTYWTSSFHRVRWYNCGRYPAYAIAARTERLHEANLTYHLWFGGGARFCNGEDSLFLRDALRAGLRIYAHPEVIGEEVPRPSTWFHGFDDKFFYDRGVLYHYLYGAFAPLMGFRWLWRNRAAMCAEYPYKRAREQMRAGYRLKKPEEENTGK